MEKELTAEPKRINKIFDVIKNNTKFCSSCGKPFDMKASEHKHFPFGKCCRAGIIKRELGSTERES